MKRFLATNWLWLALPLMALAAPATGAVVLSATVPHEHASTMSLHFPVDLGPNKSCAWGAVCELRGQPDFYRAKP